MHGVMQAMQLGTICWLRGLADMWAACRDWLRMHSYELGGFACRRSVLKTDILVQDACCHWILSHLVHILSHEFCCSYALAMLSHCHLVFT